MANIANLQAIGSVSKGLITNNALLAASFKKMSVEQIINFALTENMSKADFFATLQKAKLTREQRKNIAAQLEAAGAIGTTTAATNAQAGATDNATRATGGLSAAMKGLWLSHPYVVIIAGIAAALYGMAKYSEYQKQKLDDLRSSYESLTSEVSSLESELKTTGSRLKELQELVDKGSISVAEAEELELLKETNEELQTQLTIKQKLQEIEAKNLEKEAIQQYSKTMFEGVTTYQDSARGDRPVFEQLDAATAIPQYIAKLKELEPVFTNKSDSGIIKA